MEIFKQLEGDVADLSSCVASWRYSASFRDSYTPDSRPTSFSETEYNGVRPPSEHYDQRSISMSINSLESTLTSSKEEVSFKTSSGSETRLLPEDDSAHGSSSYSPVLSSNQGPVTSTSGYSTLVNGSGLVTSATTSNIAGTKQRQSSASPQLKGSTSLNKISNSPIMLSRLQDETGSVISRNSSESIDSGIQFENGSANGVEASSTAVTDVTATTEPEEGLGDFASDILSMLGLKS